MDPTIRARTLGTAAALVAAGLLGAPTGSAQPPLPLAPAQGCTFPTDGFTVNRAGGSQIVVASQSGGTALGPTAIYDSGGHRVVGDVTRGAINGSKIDFTVDYEGGPSVRPSEVYHGDIFDDGSVSGDAFDFSHPKVHWTAVRAAIACTN